MYLSYFGLTRNPFQISTDPQFLWLGEKHKEALAVLRYGILDDRGCLLLTGDVGAGKTTLIRALLEELGENVVSALIPDPGLSRRDLFFSIFKSFALQGRPSSKGEFLVALEEYLHRQHDAGKKVVLIIDEAQRLNSFLLEEIRLLSNIEKPDKKLITIFFVGQEEFHDLLKDERNRAIRQRITVRYHIEPLDPEEVSDYVRHRLRKAGAQRDLFSQDALGEVYAFSKGCPRRINTICDRSLLTAYVKRENLVGAETVRECAAELEIKPLKDKKPDLDFPQTPVPEQIIHADISKAVEPEPEGLPPQKPILAPETPLVEAPEPVSEARAQGSPEQTPHAAPERIADWKDPVHRRKIALYLGLVLSILLFVVYYFGPRPVSFFSTGVRDTPSRGGPSEIVGENRTGDKTTGKVEQASQQPEPATSPADGEGKPPTPLPDETAAPVLPAGGRSPEKETTRRAGAEGGGPGSAAVAGLGPEESQGLDLEALEEMECELALPILKEKLKKDPAQGRLWFLMGSCLSSLGQGKEAIEAYKQTIAFQPDNADAHYRLGVEYRLADLNEEALISLENALALEPANEEIYYQLGSVYEASGQSEKALEMLHRAVELAPSLMKAYSVLAQIYGKLGQLEKELDVYNEMLRIEPSDFSTLFNRGVTYMKLGDSESAVDSLEQARAIRNEYPMTYFLLGQCYMAAGDREKAFQQYDVLKTLSPDLAQRLYQRLHSHGTQQEVSETDPTNAFTGRMNR